LARALNERKQFAQDFGAGSGVGVQARTEVDQHTRTRSGAPEAEGTEGVRHAALEIAERRAQKLRAVKEALGAGDTETAVRLMCEFFGISQVQVRGNRDKE